MKVKKILIPLLLVLLVGTLFSAKSPDWWVQRGVVGASSGQFTSSTIESNYDIANLGQLKFISARGADELNLKLANIGGAGSEISDMVNAFTAYSSENPDINYNSLNIGQLKHVSSAFYRRLRSLPAGKVIFSGGMVFQGGLSNNIYRYPWADAQDEASIASNYELANIGQLKFLFGWEIVNFYDSDSNGLDDAWESFYYSGINVNAFADNDNDGLSNLEEFFLGTNPTNVDSDGDGVTDGLEFALSSDPTNSNSIPQLAQIDFFEDFESYDAGSLPSLPYLTWSGDVLLFVDNSEQVFLGNSLKADFGANEKSSLSFNFINAQNTSSWVDFEARVEQFESAPNLTAGDLRATNFYFKDNRIYYLDGNVWKNTEVVNSSASGRITVKRAYDESLESKGKWDLWFDKVKYVSAADFYIGYNALLPKFAELRFLANECSLYLDNVSALNNSPDDYGDFDDDADGLANDYELLLGTNPHNFDSDSDGLSDGLEVLFGMNPSASEDNIAQNQNTQGNGFFWSCGFGSVEGFQAGNLGFQKGWSSLNSLITQEENLLLESDENSSAYASRAFNTFGHKQIWIGFDARFTNPILPDSIAYSENTAATFSLSSDNLGGLYYYDSIGKHWISLSSVTFLPNSWNRFYVCLDYDLKKVTLVVNGEDVPVAIPFADTIAKSLSRFYASSSFRNGDVQPNIEFDNIFVSDTRPSYTPIEGVVLDENANGIPDWYEYGSGGIENLMATFKLSAESATSQTYTDPNDIEPFKVKLTDKLGNPIANKNISFQVVQGGGVLGTASGSTDSDGLIICAYTPDDSHDTNYIKASVASGLHSNEVGFNVTKSKEFVLPSDYLNTYLSSIKETDTPFSSSKNRYLRHFSEYVSYYKTISVMVSAYDGYDGYTGSYQSGVCYANDTGITLSAYEYNADPYDGRSWMSANTTSSYEPIYHEPVPLSTYVTQNLHFLYISSLYETRMHHDFFFGGVYEGQSGWSDNMANIDMGGGGYNNIFYVSPPGGYSSLYHEGYGAASCKIFGPWIYNIPLDEYNPNMQLATVGSAPIKNPTSLYLHTPSWDQDQAIINFDPEFVCMQFRIYDHEVELVSSTDTPLNGIKFTEASGVDKDGRETLVLLFERQTRFSVTGNILLTLTLNGVDKEFRYPVKWDPIDPPFSSYLSDAASSKYRKISLIGRPIADEKPQQKEETDYTPPETYVDAMSLQLRQDNVDLSVLTPSAELSLSVRRNYNPSVWSLTSDLRPHETPENAFGANWSSNIVAYAKSQQYFTTGEYVKRSSPDTITLIDENGAPYTFVIYYALNETSKNPYLPLSVFNLENAHFVAMPNGMHDTNAYLSELKYVPEVTGSPAKFILTKQYGTVLTYEAVKNLTTDISNDRLFGSKSFTKISYARLVSVVDKYLYKLSYNYPSAYDADIPTLIPSQILFLNSNTPIGSTSGSSLSLKIEQKNGKISRIWDAQGNFVEYGYDSAGITVNSNLTDAENAYLWENNLTIKSGALLTLVKRGDIDVFRYNYGNSITTESHIHSTSTDNDYYHFHLNLKEITDGNGNKYKFEYYDLPEEWVKRGLKSRTDDAVFVPSGAPASLKKITLPMLDAEGNALYSFFEPDTDILLTYNGDWEPVMDSSNGRINKRKTFVTDAKGNKIVYTWYDEGDSEEFPILITEMVDFCEPYGVSSEDNFSFPVMGYFKKMRIQYLSEEGVPTLHESYEFEPQFGMSLVKSTDINGNVTTFEYDSSATISTSPDDDVAPYANGYPMPIAEVDANGNRKEYSYVILNSTVNPGVSFRLMNGSLLKTPAGVIVNKTQYILDEFGSVSEERVFGGSNMTNILKRTQNQYTNSDYKSFLTKSTVIDGNSSSNYEKSYTADTYGRLASETVSPDYLRITTSYEYNKNGRKIKIVDPNGNVSSIERDSFDRPVKLYNPDGTLKIFAYDGNSNKISETDERGTLTGFTYDTLNRLTATTLFMQEGDGNDIVKEQGFDAIGNMTESVDANGNSTKFTYDILGRPIAIEYPDGGVEQRAYDGNSGSSLFSSQGFKPTKITDQLGYVTEFTYDSIYRLISQKAFYETPGGTGNFAETSYVYDAAGNKIAETDPLGNTTDYVYDALNRQIKITYPLVAGESQRAYNTFEYSPNGLLLLKVDELGNNFIKEYDNAGRLKLDVMPWVYDEKRGYDAAPYVVYEYDANGNVIVTKDAYARETLSVYDVRNRPIYKIMPPVDILEGREFLTYSSVYATEYDAVGNKVKETDPSGNETYYYYDRAQRLTQTTTPPVLVDNESAPRPLISYLRYDFNGNPVLTIDARGKSVRTVYDVMNRPISQIKDYTSNPLDGENIAELKTYDNIGNVTSVADGKGNVTQYAYDGLKRKIMSKYAVGQSVERTEHFGYNAMYLISKVDSKGVTLTSAYDAKGRITTQNNSTFTYQYAYDACNRILNVRKDNVIEVEYVYDSNGRIVSETSNGLTHYNYYDVLGNALRSEYQYNLDEAPFVVNREYNTHNKLTKLTYSEDVFRYYYDAEDNTVLVTYPNGILSAKSYDATNRLVEISEYSKNGALAYAYDYAYDASGNLARQERASNISAVTDELVMSTYDGLNRLKTNAQTGVENGAVITYAYDGASNLLSKKNGDSYVLGASYNALNAPVNAEIGSVSGAYVYDGNGNRVADFYTNTVSMPIAHIGQGVNSSQSTNEGNAYTYDTINRLVATSAGLDYAYDYRTRMLTENRFEAGGANPNSLYTRHFTYFGGTSVAEAEVYDDEGLVRKVKTRINVRGPDLGGGVGGLLCILTRDDSAEGNAFVLKYNHYNLRGDVVVSSKANGTFYDYSGYTEFGGIINPSAGLLHSGDYKSNTKYRMPGTRPVVNEGKRWRDPVLGLFLTPDPLEYVDGPNIYIYCGQNPWGNYDPLGLAKSWGQAITDSMIAKARNESNVTDPLLEVAQGIAARTAPLTRAINSIENVTNSPQFQGSLQMIGGMAEAIGGGSLMPEAPYLGAPIAAHGLDNTVAGVRTLYSGVQTDTYTSRLLLQEGLGMSKSSANITDAAIGIAGGLATAANGVNGAVKVLASPEAKGMSKIQALLRNERGAVAMSDMDFAKANAIAPTQIGKAILFEKGIIEQPKFSFLGSIKLCLKGTGNTPLANVGAGAITTAANAKRGNDADERK